MDRVLVTGGTGFIGYFLVQQLVLKGYDVTVIDNLSRGSLDWKFRSLLPDIRFIEADLTHPLDDLSLEGNYRYVFHLAAVNGVKFANETPERVLRTNALSTIQVLDYCSKHPPENVMYASSSEVYQGALRRFDLTLPTPETVPLIIDDPNVARYAYACSKIFGELMMVHYAKRFGFRSRVVRYHNIYGPRMGVDHVIPEVLNRIVEKQSPFPMYGADQTRSFCYVTDAVEATLEFGVLQDESNHIVNIGNSNREISIRELYLLLFEMTNYTADLLEMAAPAGSPDRRCPSTALLERLIQFYPKVGLEEGLRSTIDWYCSDTMRS